MPGYSTAVLAGSQIMAECSEQTQYLPRDPVDWDSKTLVLESRANCAARCFK